jgi:hypothetical protein
MRPLLRLLPLVLAFALAGCGQATSSASNFKGQQKAVADTIEQLQSSAQSRKPETICADVLSRALIEKLKTSGNACVDEMDDIIGDADDDELDVRAVTITGATAVARVKARRGRDKNAITNFSLVREDGKWRLTNFGAS